jgi:hypothetical protein
MYRCPECNKLVRQLFETAIGWACPPCAKAIAEARALEAQPGLSPEARGFLDFVIGAALFVGAIKLLDKLP